MATVEPRCLAPLEFSSSTGRFQVDSYKANLMETKGRRGKSEGNAKERGKGIIQVDLDAYASRPIHAHPQYDSNGISIPLWSKLSPIRE